MTMMKFNCGNVNIIITSNVKRGRRDARFRNMCIKIRISDDFKGRIVCFFAVMFHEFWERHLVFISFFPRYFAFVILVVVVFFLLHFSFFFGPFELYIIYVPMMSYRFRMSIHIKQPESNPFTPQVTNHVQWFRMCHIIDFGPFGSFRSTQHSRDLVV